MYPTICNLVTTNNELLARVTKFSCYLNRNNGTPWIVPVISVFFLIEIWMDVERSYFLHVKPARHYCLSQYCIPSSNREGRALNFSRGYKSTNISMWMTVMQEETAALHKNNTWDFDPLPQGRKTVGNKWELQFFFSNRRTTKISLLLGEYTSLTLSQIPHNFIGLLSLHLLSSCFLSWRA